MSTVLELFEIAAETSGARTSIIQESGEAISYFLLNKTAYYLAISILPYLPEINNVDNFIVHVPVLICILCDRHIGAITAMISTLKLGAGYVPVDPTFPFERQQYIIMQSRCKIIIMDEKSYVNAHALTTSGVAVVIIDTFGNVVQSLPPHSQNHNNNTNLSNIDQCMKMRRKSAEAEKGGGIMYVLYTSGSTGKPKGVSVLHQGVSNVVNWFAHELKVTTSTRILGLTTFCFDISVLEIYLALTQGATIVLVQSTTQKDPYRLIDIIQEHNVTVIQATPTSFEMMLATGWKGDPRIDFIVGGEEFRPVLHTITQNCRSFRNGYGPTEASIYASCYLVQDLMNKIPIGSPLGDTQFYLVDPVQAGSGVFQLAQQDEGELLIGGIGVAKGYLYNEELTKQRFIPNPFGNGTVYRSGDLVRRIGPNNYVYMGRLDDQVKINGFRIELGEIDNVFSSHKHVDRAVTFLRDKVLVVYLKLHSVLGLDLSVILTDIQANSARSLPAYMMPKSAILVDYIPLTGSGKLDRQALLHTHGKEMEFPQEEGRYLEQKSAPTAELEQQNGQRCLAMEEHIIVVVHHATGRLIYPSSSLSSFGIDSLASAYFLRALVDSFGGEVRIKPSNIFSSEMTVQKFAAQLYSQLLLEHPALLMNMGFSLSDLKKDDIFVPQHGSDNNNYEGSTSNIYSEQYYSELISSNVRFLQGLRGFIAFMVLYDHFRPPGIPFSQAFFSNATLFVILTGFTTGLQLIATDETFQLKPFLFSKAVGLYPILWLALLLNAPRWWLQTHPLVPDPTIREYFGLSPPELTNTVVGTCAFLYTIGFDSWVRYIGNYCLASGPKDVYYGGALFNVFILFCTLFKIVQILYKYTPQGLLQIYTRFVQSNILIYISFSLTLSVILIILGSLGGSRFSALVFLPYFLSGYNTAHSVSVLYRKIIDFRSKSEGHSYYDLIFAKLFRLCPDLIWGCFCICLTTLGPLSNYNNQWFLHWYGMPILLTIFIIVSTLQSKFSFVRCIFEHTILNILGYSSYALYLLQDVILNFYVHLIKDDINTRSFPWPSNKQLTIAYDYYHQTGRWFSSEPLGERIILISCLIMLCYCVHKYYQDIFVLRVVSMLMKYYQKYHHAASNEEEISNSIHVKYRRVSTTEDV